MGKDIFESKAFLQYLSDSEEPYPLSVSLDVTNNCNFRCCHCYVKHSFASREEEMSLETIQSIINQISDYGVPIIYLTGGEALLRKDLTEIVRYAKVHNLSVNLKTNGSLLNDEIIKTFRRDCIDDIQISIYGMNNEEYSLVTSCSPESRMFDVVKTNVEKLVESGIQIGLRYIALKHNYRSCVQFIKWCRELGLSLNQYFHSTDIQPASSCSLEPLDFALTAEENRELMDRIMNYDKQYLKNLYKLPKKYRKCNVGKHSIHINNSGDVYPCAGFPIIIGNIYKETYSDIWESSEKLNMLRNLKVEEISCSECEDNDYCMSNCMGAIYNWNEHSSFQCKNERYCRLQQENIKVLKELKDSGCL